MKELLLFVCTNILLFPFSIPPSGKNFATKLSIDIIATRIIEEGEEILLDFENGEMKDDMISSNWTTYT